MLHPDSNREPFKYFCIHLKKSCRLNLPRGCAGSNLFKVYAKENL